MQTRRHNHRCIFIYKCLNDLIDFKFEFSKNEDIHSYYTKKRPPPPKDKHKQGKTKSKLPSIYRLQQPADLPTQVAEIVSCYLKS